MTQDSCRRKRTANAVAATPLDTAGDLPDWDSVAHVTIVLAVEKEFKVKFKGAEIATAVMVENQLGETTASGTAVVELQSRHKPGGGAA